MEKTKMYKDVHQKRIDGINNFKDQLDDLEKVIIETDISQIYDILPITIISDSPMYYEQEKCDSDNFVIVYEKGYFHSGKYNGGLEISGSYFANDILDISELEWYPNVLEKFSENIDNITQRIEYILNERIG